MMYIKIAIQMNGERTRAIITITNPMFLKKAKTMKEMKITFYKADVSAMVSITIPNIATPIRPNSHSEHMQLRQVLFNLIDAKI